MSLQKDPRADDRAVPLERTDIVDLTADLTDFVETAALVSCLDLVITVDTSVAHLAAALGRPIWILLPYTPDYRWLLGRDDSPWYPTMRLFGRPKLANIQGCSIGAKRVAGADRQQTIRTVRIRRKTTASARWPPAPSQLNLHTSDS